MRFDTEYLAAVEFLLKDGFEKYHVYLDFLVDKLGKSAVEDRAQEIYAGLSDEMIKQVIAYKNGAKNKAWMLNRGNLKYIIDNDLV